MVDLQRCMCVIWKIERPRMQYARENSDNDVSRAPVSVKPFRRSESGENIVRPDWGRIGPNHRSFALEPRQAFRCLMVNAARWPAISSGLNGGPVNAPIASRASAGLLARPSA